MTPGESIVYLLDDEPGIIRALTRLLTPLGYQVRGYTSSASFLEAWQSAARSCLILDVSMPDLNGLTLQQRLAQNAVLLPIVFLTGKGDIPMTVRAMKAGAVDFLTKPVRKEDLVRAVEAALARSEEQQKEAAMSRRLSLLTPREREVMEHIVAGRLNKQIAADLGTGEQNIKFHRAHVMQKLEMGSLAELVRFAGKLGITTPKTGS